MTKRGIKATAPRLPRPDVDNIAKAVLDALQPVIGDDTNVSTLIAMKAYSEHAGTHVVIEPVEAA
jgi:Holliday junction resolvase RusA-like endonuclease